MSALVIVLHNVRSVQNVGSIFRTADAVGAKEIVLTGYTPTPQDRFGRVRSDMHKTALGAEKDVLWRYERNITTALSKLRSQGYSIVGVEQDSKAMHYKKFRPSRKIAVVFGNEVRGLSSTLRRVCDALIEIPMRGKKESLNVSVAAGIVLFALTQ